MISLARSCARHAALIIAGWVVLLAALGTAATLAGSALSDSSRLPASDSSTAYDLLAESDSDAADVTTGTIVWHTESRATSAATQRRLAPVLASVAGVDGVRAVVSPFTAAGAGQVSGDRRTAFATVVFASDTHADTVRHLAEQASSDQLTVQVGGTAFDHVSPSSISEIIGVLAALLILLVVFGSVWAAVLPVCTGIAGVGASTFVVLLLSHVLTLPTVAPELGALIGLGVGIDYALFIVHRHRRALRDGQDVPGAAATALGSAGRAVLFAGGTVVVALLGMLVLGVGFLTGLGIAAAITVLLTVLAAVTLLPALLIACGPRVLRRSERARPSSEDGGWGRWAATVRRRPVATCLAALAVLVAVAAPALAIRLGAADASSDPHGSGTRDYYDTMAASFGEGFDASLLLVAETPDAAARSAWTDLLAALPHEPGVAAVGASHDVGDGRLATVQVTPTTAGQDEATSDLVRRLRSDVVPAAESGTALQVHVGGRTATSIDFADTLTSKLPLFLIIIAVLGFALLTVAFRSLLVPLIGAVGNLLTIAVALGSTTALFQWGWGPTLFGVGGPAPVEYTVAILIVGVMFGLSMDYHVFLISRVHEQWSRARRHDEAVTTGVGEAGTVVVTAAVIMACVFASFGVSGVRTISEFGVGLAVAVLCDALLLRMTVVPAVLHLVGRRVWTLPAWLDRVLPHVSIEPPSREVASASLDRVESEVTRQAPSSCS